MELEKEFEIDLTKCVRALLHNWWVILLSTLLCLLVGILFTWNRSPDIYYAKSTVYSAAYGSYEQSAESTRAMQAYAELVKSLKVSERAVLLLGDETATPQMILSSVDVSYTTDSPILSILAYSTKKEEAIKISKAVANAFVIEMKNITGKENIQMLDEAYDVKIRHDGNNEQIKKRGIFALAGFLLSGLFFVIREIFSKRVVYVNDVTLNGKIEILGVIPRGEGK